MRPIKFRAWDVVDKRMVWLDYIWNEWWYGSPQGENGKAVYFNDNRSMDERRIGGFHIMQFTGLKDCKGVEIYEGDIVRVRGLNSEVFFWEDHADYRLVPFDCRNEWDKTRPITFVKIGEIIGNIYENPELLE